MSTQNNHYEISIDKAEEGLNFKKIINSVVEKWPWFIISVIFCTIISYLYYNYTPPVYPINARILVSNGDNKGGGEGLMDIGKLVGSKNSVENEIEILKTRYLMEQVVKELQLNVVYSQRIGLKNMELYDVPFKLEIISQQDTIFGSSFELTPVNQGTFKLKVNETEVSFKFNQIFDLEGVGKVKINSIPNAKFDGKPYLCNITSVDNRAAQLMGQLTVNLTNIKVSVIELGLVYPVQKKGEDILNALIRQYIKSNLEDKNAIADSTTKFILSRINLIAKELGDVEQDEQDFKQKYKVADMSEQGRQLVRNTSEYVNELAKVEVQLSNIRELQKYLKDVNNRRVLPSGIGEVDQIFVSTIERYNSLLVERDKQLGSVTESSPFIKTLDQQIANLRSDLLSSAKQSEQILNVRKSTINGQISSVDNNITTVPVIEKNYLKLARNKQIKSELYIFLMQKAEETAISKTANISIAKTIDPPRAGVYPMSPNKKVIYFAGLLAGLVIPMLLIALINILSTSVSTKEDIVALVNVPIIGEISHNPENDNLIVANKGRSAISEQFRALRTNLSFYLKSKDEKVILLTSSMSGEGKSFTAINLGNILALTGKKVLLMELDLRKPGLSQKLNIPNNLGFSNYTINPEIKFSDIIKPLSINPNMFIISSGPLPPNPAESLMSDSMPLLMNYLKSEFDYVIMDAPPVGIVTDAQLLANYADATLYLVRQKVTKKDQLRIPEDLHRTGKLKNMGIVVNDIVNKYYGYGYGYGSYGDGEKKGWFSSFLKRIGLSR